VLHRVPTVTPLPDPVDVALGTKQPAPQLVPIRPLERRRHDRSGTRVAPSISVVIPALNEERNLPHVLTQVPDHVTEILVVDGLSTDRTIAVARETLPDVRIVEQQGRGKGNALQAGFAACKGDVVVMLDADGSMNPSEIPSFVQELQAGAEFVKGSRFLPDGGSDDLTPLRKVGNFGLRTAFNVLYGAKHTDLCYGFAAFWRRCLPNLAFDHDGFEVETVLCIRAAQAKLRVREIPSYELSRNFGQSNLHAFRDGFRILRVLISGAG
jgi:glycosyltransferase involved in cell wall biosynthesis